MIPITDLSLQTESWQMQLHNAVTSREALMDYLGLPNETVKTNFPIKVPAAYLSRIEKGNPEDPLLRQVLSQAVENLNSPGFVDEPLNEAAFSPIKGLIHKYSNRVLIVTTGTCAINCRYCFRRNFDYQGNQANSLDWQGIFTYLNANKNIREVILSGGEPLVLGDRQLARIMDSLSEIDHLTSVRIHSRMPVVIPQRVCDEMLSWTKSSRLKIILVTHINHPNEIDDAVVDSMKLLSMHQVLLLNQSVLLKSVNDDVATLVRLSERLFFAGILPYYLHLLDPVTGAAHFDVEQQEALQLMTQVRSQLPGYLVPALVREVPGESSKRPVI